MTEGDAGRSLGQFTARLKRLRPAALREYGVVLVFVVLFVALAISSEPFLHKENLLNILEQWSDVGIVACGVTLVMIAGGLDLSVGAIYALSGVIAAKVAIDTSVELGLVVGALAGLGMGAVNGLLVTVGRINSFIGTLGSSIVFRGLALIVTTGLLVQVEETSFRSLGSDEFLSAKVSIYCWAAFIIVCAVILNRTVLGRYIFAAGGNAEAARLSGVRVGLVQAITFSISGFAAGFAGLIVASRGGSGSGQIGIDLPLTVVAAVVLGGTSILGGSGAIWRTVLGVLVLALVRNGLNLLDVDVNYQQVVTGGILLAAVAIDAWARGAGTGPRLLRLGRARGSGSSTDAA